MPNLLKELEIIEGITSYLITVYDESAHTKIGALNSLTTTDKSSIVNAINEVVSDVVRVEGKADTNAQNLAQEILDRISGDNTLSDKIGNLDNLNTTVKTNLVNAINEVNTKVDNFNGLPVKMYYVKDYGAVGDGTTDDTQAIQSAINACGENGAVVFDPVTYKISSPLVVTHSFVTLMGYVDNQRGLGGAVIISTSSSANVLTIGDGTTLYEGITVKNLHFKRNSMGDVGSKTIVVNKCLYTRFVDCGWSMSQYGLYGTLINGLFVNRCHGTTNGDLSGESIYGIYIDGTGNADNSGLIVNGYIYYGYESPNSISHAIACVATAQGGDIRIYDVECSGDVNYGIYINAGGGFSADVIIDGLSMDSCKSIGVYLVSSAGYNWQNANISNVWILNSGSNSYGININKYNGVNINNVSITGGDGASGITAIQLENTKNCNINNIVVRNSIAKIMQLTSTENIMISNVICDIIDVHLWVTTISNCLFNMLNIKGVVQGITGLTNVKVVNSIENGTFVQLRPDEETEP